MKLQPHEIEQQSKAAFEIMKNVNIKSDATAVELFVLGFLYGRQHLKEEIGLMDDSDEKTYNSLE